MVKQRLFLGSVAFGISFGISFLTGRGIGSAIASGVTTTVAAVVAAAVVDRQQNQHAHSRIADLKNHIQALQQRRAEAYQAYMQLEAEKEHLAISLNTLAFQSGQPYMMGSPVTKMLPASRRTLSWNLAASAESESSGHARPRVQAYELPTEISTSSAAASSAAWGRSVTEISPQILADAAAAKQKIETSLAALQTELSQIKGHITDHRQTREKLSRDVADVREEKRQLDATVKTLRDEVQALETCRVELEQFLADAEAKKQELESGSNPLQEALKQLQTQVGLLQEELRVLEAQILDRRSQKELLEQQLAALNALQPASQAPLVSKNGSAKNGSSNNQVDVKNQADAKAAIPTKKTIASQNTSAKRPVTIAPARPLQSGSTQVNAAAVLPEPTSADKPSNELPNEWTEFMVQSPEYELQVLKVIVEQNNPAVMLKHIAEENLTMPELLIDSINERALETIGDLLIDASAGAKAAVIVRDHLKTVKKLLKTYEYLVN
jgi:phage shock protein A